jgi:hypothetical protein
MVTPLGGPVLDSQPMLWTAPRRVESLSLVSVMQHQQHGNGRFRLRRLAEFRRRAEYGPETVYRHRTRGWEYIPIHPFGDEAEDLQRLKLNATGKTEGDVALDQPT